MILFKTQPIIEPKIKYYLNHKKTGHDLLISCFKVRHQIHFKLVTLKGRFFINSFIDPPAKQVVVLSHTLCVLNRPLGRI